MLKSMVHYLVTIAFVVLVVVFAIVLSLKLNLPPVIGLLLAGIVTGPSLFGIIDSGVGVLGTNYRIIQDIGEIGSILLLFTIGIEFNITKLLRGGFRIFLIFLFKLGLTFTSGYVVTILLGYTPLAALFIGAIISITSTAIFVKVLSQEGVYGRKEVPILIGVLIIEDIFAVLALTFFSQINGSESVSALGIVFNFFMAGIFLILAYFVINRLVIRVMAWIKRYQSQETFIFIAFGLCLGMASISGVLGFAPTAGAFLAGSIVGNLKQSKKFEHSIRPFTLVFVSLFFLAIGMQVNLGSIFSSPILIILLLVVTVITSIIGTALPAYFLEGMNFRNALFAGIAMIPMGEFSLLIAKEANSANIGLDLVSITSAVILGSAVIMSFGVRSTDLLASVLCMFSTESFKVRSRYISSRIALTLRQFERKGKIYNEYQKQRYILLRYAILFIGLGIVLVTAIYMSEFILEFLSAYSDLSDMLYLVFQVVLISTIVVITLIFLKNIKKTLDLFTRVLLKSKKQDNERRAFRYLVIGLIIIFMAFIAVPLAISDLRLPRYYYAISAILIIIAVFLIWLSLYIFDKIISGAGSPSRLSKRLKQSQEKWKNDIIVDWEKDK